MVPVGRHMLIWPDWLHKEP